MLGRGKNEPPKDSRSPLLWVSARGANISSYPASARQQSHTAPSPHIGDSQGRRLDAPPDARIAGRGLFLHPSSRSIAMLRGDNGVAKQSAKSALPTAAHQIYAPNRVIQRTS